MSFGDCPFGWKRFVRRQIARRNAGFQRVGDLAKEWDVVGQQLGLAKESFLF